MQKGLISAKVRFPENLLICELFLESGERSYQLKGPFCKNYMTSTIFFIQINKLFCKKVLTPNGAFLTIYFLAQKIFIFWKKGAFLHFPFLDKIPWNILQEGPITWCNLFAFLFCASKKESGCIRKPISYCGLTDNNFLLKRHKVLCVLSAW